MRTAQHIFRSLTAALAATASLLLCLAVSCRRAPAPLPDDFGVTVLIDNPSSSDGTKAIADNEINSIAIFAFSAVSGELAGYVYESGLTGKTTFPMTLKASGAIDFYAIANPDPGYFRIVDANGNLVNLRSAANPPEYDGTDIQNWRVEINDASSRPDEAAPWYAPMSNLSGAGGTNRRYTIDPDDNWTVIPLELTRAVSKIEVWFRSNDQIYENEDKYSLLNRQPDADNRTSYYSIQTLTLSLPVESVGMYTSVVSYDVNNKFRVSINDLSYKTVNEGHKFVDYDKGNIPSDFYSEKYFKQVWKYYIFHNLVGGNMAGENVSGQDTENYTTLIVDYAYWEDKGYYKNNGRDGVYHVWKWIEDVQIADDFTDKDKFIYIPPCERNSVIRVWCNLNDNTDRSFTYTVVDWDETVEVNVPDFE